MRTILVLLPHPDDEFALFPWLEDAVARGDDLHCVYTSDGATVRASAARREAESLGVLARCGLAPSSVHFVGREVGIADGQVHACLPQLVEALHARFPERDGSTVWVPAWEGGHPDHDATHLAGIALARGYDVELEQYPVYRAMGLGFLFWVIDPLAANGVGRGHRTGIGRRLTYVMRCLQYRSQWRSFVGLLPLYAWRLFTRATPFVLQPVDVARTVGAPHPGAPLYERRDMLTWAMFAQATRRYRANAQEGREA